VVVIRVGVVVLALLGYRLLVRPAPAPLVESGSTTARP